MHRSRFYVLVSLVIKSMQKDSSEDMYSFSAQRSMMSVKFVLQSKRPFSEVLDGVTLRKVSLAPLTYMSSCYSFARMMPSTYVLCNLRNFSYDCNGIRVYSHLRWVLPFLYFFIIFDCKLCCFSHNTHSCYKAITNYTF